MFHVLLLLRFTAATVAIAAAFFFFFFVVLLASILLAFSGELGLFGVRELAVESGGLLATFADGLALSEKRVLLVLDHEHAISGDGALGSKEGDGEAEHFFFFWEEEEDFCLCLEQKEAKEVELNFIGVGGNDEFSRAGRKS